MYQSLLVLVIVYAAMFLAQATGPAKASLLQIDPTLDDASRSLGRGRFDTLRKIPLPLMSRGLLAGGLLVFVTTLKELARRWYPGHRAPPKSDSHRARDDILESVAELRFYRQNFFGSPEAP